MASLTTQPGSAEAPAEAAALALPASAAEIRGRLDALRAAGPIRSADGRTWIVGPALTAPDKLVLLRFLEDLRSRTARILRISLEGPDYAAALCAVQGEPDEPCRVQVDVTRGAVPPIRIVVVNPESLHPPDLARHFCSALLRADALAHGYADAASASAGDLPSLPYPAWFGTGLARWLETARRQADAENVLSRWERGQLPAVHGLTEFFSPYAASDPALAAQLVAWLLDAPERGGFFASLRDALTQGTPWSFALYAKTMGLGPDDPVDAERRWGSWWLSRRWTVLTAGTTEPGLVLRTRAQLRVWPGNPGTPLAAFLRRSPPVEPRDLIALRESPWIGATASFQVTRMQRLASGRDAAYRAMAEAYTAFFVGLQRGEPESRLDRLLQTADTLLLRLEESAEDGPLERLSAD